MGKLVDSMLEALEINNNTLVNSLLTVPKKAKKEFLPKLKVYKRDSVHQADLLFLPSDQGYKYLLVIVDVATRSVDAEPLKSKTQPDVLKAIVKIYKRKYLEIPTDLFCVDAGSEFKGKIKMYFNKHKVIIRVGKPGRHRQQCYVEWYNGIIGDALNKIMLIAETNSGVQSKVWKKYVPKIIEMLNTKYFRKVVDKLSGSPIQTNEELLEEGATVRIQLDKPKDYLTGKRLIGKFRKGDMRWSPETYKIEQVLIRPEQPPMYLVEGIKECAFIRKQLQVVDQVKEIKEVKYIVEKILDKRKNKKKIEYLVKWKHYPTKYNTWEPRTNLIDDGLKWMIDNYEKSI